MIHPRRLLALASVALCGLLAFAIVTPPASGGSVDDPEITDQANDQLLMDEQQIPVQPSTSTSVGPTGVQGGTTAGLNSDILAAWISNETAQSIQLNIRLQGNGAPTTSSQTVYTFHLEVAGQGYDATATVEAAPAAPANSVTRPPVPGSGGITAGGVAESATREPNIISMVVPLADIGGPGPGDAVTGMFVTAEGRLLAQVDDFTTDRAPNTGVGRDYILGGGGTGGLPGDTDSDGLNDTWEQQHFGNLTLHNGTSDPDADGLNNTAEYAAGTDPNDADSDDDGTPDGTDPEPMDATQGGAGNGTGTQTSSGTGTGTGSGTGTGTGTSSGTGTGSQGQDKGNDAEGTDEGVLQRFTSEPGYLMVSLAGAGAVVLVSIVGLAGRWRM